MKKFLSCVIFIVVLSGIISITIYTLNNKGIREEPKTTIKNKIEKVTSNISNNTLSEMYNVYFNELRHKVKLEYSIILKDDIYSLYLVVYFDGKSILTGYVASSMELKTIEEFLKDENIDSFVRLSEKNIQIMKDDNKEYLVLHVGYFDNTLKEKYFVFNNEGNMLVDDGILVVDLSNYFVSSDEAELDIFYDGEYQCLAKIEGNTIYAIEPKNEKNKWTINEYKYVFKDDNMTKELVNTYNDVKLKEIAE